MKFHVLKVATVESTGAGDGILVTLEVPLGLRDTYRWSAGQHLTLEVAVGADTLRRSYSICAAHEPGDPLRLGIKRIADGRVSNHLNDRLRAGHTVHASQPFGHFVLTPDPRARRTHYFFAAGSGITPVFAMIRAVLAAEPYSVAWLFYGNRDAKHTMLGSELAALEANHPRRFAHYPVHSEPSLWGPSPWRTGRIDDEAVGAAIDTCPPEAMDTQYWICGPGTMNRDVAAALRQRDVPPGRIHFESFGTDTPGALEVEGVAAQVQVGDAVVQVEAGETVLQACQRTEVRVPYSCESGACGACRGQLDQGSVQHRLRMALTDEELQSGAVLLCQAVPTTPRVKLRVLDSK